MPLTGGNNAGGLTQNGSAAPWSPMGWLFAARDRDTPAPGAGTLSLEQQAAVTRMEQGADAPSSASADDPGED